MEFVCTIQKCRYAKLEKFRCGKKILSDLEVFRFAFAIVCGEAVNSWSKALTWVIVKGVFESPPSSFNFNINVKTSTAVDQLPSQISHQTSEPSASRCLAN
ncbi:hypothetical protein Prudu_355S000300 [Prunus dulcis]|uniref:Uncharacterized protein n=1 Tax=Prunus dulcis TaxID=3755 RepID=A0A5H2XPJ9_PRUDU|nr:hypothetical protein Prudu_355S000300 [Prunus dulcis]